MIFQILAYIKHFYRAVNVSKVENKKLRTFLEDVLDDEKKYYAFLTLSMLRKKMAKDSREIQVKDLGAGSKKLKTSNRQIKNIAKLSVKRSKYAEILFRIITKRSIETTIELGTSLGVTTGYLAMASKNSQVVTLEGCSETSKIAAENIAELGLKNVKQVLGDFDDTFVSVLKENPNSELIFIDGNHTKEATLRYYNEVLEYCNENLIIVFDDIHWSKGMEEAWYDIIANNNIMSSIDLYEMGIIFLSKDYRCGHYSIVV